MSQPNRPNSNNYGPFIPWDDDPPRLPRTRLPSLPPLPLIRTTTQSYPPLPTLPDQHNINLQENLTRIPIPQLPLNIEPNSENFTPPFADQIPLRSRSRRSLYDVLQGVEVDNKPWRAVTGLPKLHGISQHDDLESFLDYVNKNPNANQEDIQQELGKCTTQNCAENTFFGLTKMNARTEEGLSPRAELYKTKADSFSKKIESNPNFTPGHYPSYFDFPRALGINERNESLNANPETLIPRGTVVFMQNPRYNPKSNRNQEFPFDHVFYAEREGRNASPIYRHLNAPPEGEPARGSILDNLQDIIDKGNYGRYRKIYSNKWVLPEAEF